LRAHGRLGKCPNCLRDAFDTHRFRNDGFSMSFLYYVRHCRRGDRLFAAYVNTRMTAAVPELNPGFGAGIVNGVDQSVQPGNEAVITDAKFAMAMFADAFGGRHFYGDEADAGACRVVCDAVIGYKPVPVGSAGCHRCHDDAVVQRERADVRWSEQ
jgi:hypothetical protein